MPQALRQVLISAARCRRASACSRRLHAAAPAASARQTGRESVSSSLPVGRSGNFWNGRRRWRRAGEGRAEKFAGSSSIWAHCAWCFAGQALKAESSREVPPRPQPEAISRICYRTCQSRSFLPPPAGKRFVASNSPSGLKSPLRDFRHQSHCRHAVASAHITPPGAPLPASAGARSTARSSRAFLTVGTSHGTSST